MKREKKLFLDCSYLYEHPELNTGIQRVVRKVLENFNKLTKEKDMEVIPVVISHSSFFKIEEEQLFLKPATLQQDQVQQTTAKETLKIYLKNLYKATRDFIAALLPFSFIKNFLYAPRDRFGLSYIIDSLFIKPFKKRDIADKKVEKAEPDFKDGDILLLIDSTWYLDIWPTVDRLKKSGVKVVAVIYDLIPITHSQFCDDFLVQVFKEWFKTSLGYIDRFVAISHTVEKDLKKFLKEEFQTDIKDKRFDYFLLGSDFGYMEKEELPIREELKNIFEIRKNIYLTVCTIEPRKNHSYLLDAFDVLWESDMDISLMIVGRVGWKVEKVLQRINTHKNLHKKLFFYTDLNDSELKFCYENSKMLIFPSIVEGFGLPIVESLSNHLPVLASDIPIHREVGKDKIGYFDLQNPSDLSDKIKDIESNGIPKGLLPDQNFKWLSWEESSKMLLQKVLDD